MLKKGLGKERWLVGFSGKSWKELNDLWPIEMRTTSEAYWILCGFLPAHHAIRKFVANLLGIDLRSNKRFIFPFRDILLLAWISRCEEVKQGLCTEQHAIQQGTGYDIRVMWMRKASLTKLGLIENIHVAGGTRIRAYRITEKGRIVLRKFVELIDECHQKLREEWSGDREDFTKEKPIDKFLKARTEEDGGLH